MERQLLASLLDTIDQPAILIDPQYRIISANKAYQSRYQFNPNGQRLTCYEVSHGYQKPCDQQGELCPFQASVASGKPERVMHVHNTPEGKEHIDVHLQPIFDDQGQLLYFLETLCDISNDSHKAVVEQQLKGQSQVFNQMLLELTRAANSDISVLLLGESGTGKELAARFLHENSARKDKPFVTVECAGLTDSLFESELFGYRKGAFTGAVSDKLGLISSAQGGTLFLDELGDVPLTQQVKILRLIETGMYRPVGDLDNHYADFRLICATNKNLPKMIDAGEFRQDLFYRINGFPVYLPPLRERGDDVLMLAKSFLMNVSDNLLVHFSEEALEFLQEYDFPGNIRELLNLVKRANLLRDGNRIELDDIRPAHTPQLRQNNHVSTDQQASDSKQKTDEDLSELDIVSADEIIPLQRLEQDYLTQLYHRFNGNKSELASALGISERTLYRKLQAISLIS